MFRKRQYTSPSGPPQVTRSQSDSTIKFVVGAYQDDDQTLQHKANTSTGSRKFIPLTALLGSRRSSSPLHRSEHTPTQSIQKATFQNTPTDVDQSQAEFLIQLEPDTSDDDDEGDDGVGNSERVATIDQSFLTPKAHNEKPRQLIQSSSVTSFIPQSSISNFGSSAYSSRKRVIQDDDDEDDVHRQADKNLRSSFKADNHMRTESDALDNRKDVSKIELILSSSPSPKEWSCGACTFLNSDELNICELCETARYEEDKRMTRSKQKLKLQGFEEKENFATTHSLVPRKELHSSGKKSRASQLLELGTKMHEKDVSSLNDFDQSEMKRRKKELNKHSDDDDDDFQVLMEGMVTKTSKNCDFGVNEDNLGVRGRNVTETTKEKVDWKFPHATSSKHRKAEKQFDHFE
jgi:hypothetical protein